MYLIMLPGNAWRDAAGNLYEVAWNVGDETSLPAFYVLKNQRVIRLFAFQDEAEQFLTYVLKNNPTDAEMQSFTAAS